MRNKDLILMGLFAIVFLLGALMGYEKGKGKDKFSDNMKDAKFETIIISGVERNILTFAVD